MQINELIQQINNATEQQDYATARLYVENNYELLAEHKHLLNANARDILGIVNEWKEKGISPVSKVEMATINSVNNYAKRFNVRGVKLAVKNNPKVFLRPDITDYLNGDAKILLEGMGVIEKES